MVRKTRSRKFREFTRYVMYKGYKVYEGGVVHGHRGIIKPKFLFKGKRIDYVYIEIYEKGKKKRISYHRFIYSAFNPTFNDDTMVVTTIGSRFDYRLSNLRCIPREEHIKELAHNATIYKGDDLREMIETYHLVKEYITLEDYAKRLHISSRTLSNYLEKEKNE